MLCLIKKLASVNSMMQYGKYNHKTFFYCFIIVSQFTIVVILDCSTFAKGTSLYILSKRDPFSLFNAAFRSKVFEEMQVNSIRLFKWYDPNSRCNTRDAF